MDWSIWAKLNCIVDLWEVVRYKLTGPYFLTLGDRNMLLRRCFALATLFFCVFGLLSAAVAQVYLNLDDKVKALLTKWGTVVQQQYILPCEGVFVGSIFCREQFTVSNVSLEQQGEIKFGDPQDVPVFPPRPQEQVVRNCDPMASASGEFTFTRQYTSQITVTVTDQSTLTTGVTLQLQGSLPSGGPSITGQFAMQRADTLGRSVATATTINDQTTATQKVEIGKLTLEKVTFSQNPKTTRTPFSVKVVVDADIKASNHPAWKHLSDIDELGPKDKRSFDVHGQIEDTETNDVTTLVPIKLTANDCAATGTVR
jgi:hypothetical protein